MNSDNPFPKPLFASFFSFKLKLKFPIPSLLLLLSWMCFHGDLESRGLEFLSAGWTLDLVQMVKVGPFLCLSSEAPGDDALVVTSLETRFHPSLCKLLSRDGLPGVKFTGKSKKDIET